MLILAAVALAAKSAVTLSTAADAAVVVGTAVTVLGALSTFFWWLHKILNRLEGKVNKELEHNGGSSMKDMVRDARDNAKATAVAVQYLYQRVDSLEEKQADAAARVAVHVDQSRHAEQTILDRLHSLETAQSSRVIVQEPAAVHITPLN